MSDDVSEDVPEDPEGAEEALTARDAARGMGPAAVRPGGDEPRDLDNMTVGQFLDGLPPHGLEATVYINGQQWNVKRLEWGLNDEEEGQDSRGRGRHRSPAEAEERVQEE